MKQYDIEFDPKFQETMYEYQRRNFLDKKFDKRACEHFHCPCDICLI